MDSAHSSPTFYDTKSGPVIRSGALDDRLGAYVILGLLPRLGINTDVLLTVGEECAESTARYFDPSKQYDWVIEFDRAGTDVVMYQYEDEPSRRAVEAAGARMDWGSYSDIAYLEHLGVKAFNWGVGYDGNYHSVNGYAYLNDTFAMVAKYLRFHKQNAGTVMAHDPVPASQPYSGGAWDGEGECEVCFAKDSISAATLICDVCQSCQDCLEYRAACQCYTPSGTAEAAQTSEDEQEDIDDAIAGAKARWEAQTAGLEGEWAAGHPVALGSWKRDREGKCTCSPSRLFSHDASDCPLLPASELDRRVTAIHDAHATFTSDAFAGQGGDFR